LSTISNVSLPTKTPRLRGIFLIPLHCINGQGEPN
jgi:hypothetical protein